MTITYDEIRRIHRLEKNSSKLVPINVEFYNEVQEFIAEEKQKYLESINKNTSYSRDFPNIKKMIEEIFSIREKKILNNALATARTKEINEEGMASQEKKLYKELIEQIEVHEKLLEEIFNGKNKPGTDLNNVTVEFISDVPEFAGSDSHKYGPYKKGTTTTLPLKIAKLLATKKMLEIK
ncbi:MAG: hypothetical protein QXZ13_00065 [Candidatus Diapherotrites archaeon]